MGVVKSSTRVDAKAAYGLRINSKSLAIDSPLKPLSFSRAQRLRLARDFSRLRERGKRIEAGPFFLKVFDRKDKEGARFAIIASRKIGPAVVRNRLRRRTKECFRLLQHQLPQGVDLLFIARPALAHTSFQELYTRFSKAALRIENS